MLHTGGSVVIKGTARAAGRAGAHVPPAGWLKCLADLTWRRIGASIGMVEQTQFLGCGAVSSLSIASG